MFLDCFRIERLDEELIQTVKTTTEAQKWLPQNDTIPIKKNRYTNILAYDDTRLVKLRIVLYVKRDFTWIDVLKLTYKTSDKKNTQIPKKLKSPKLN